MDGGTGEKIKPIVILGELRSDVKFVTSRPLTVRSLENCENLYLIEDREFISLTDSMVIFLLSCLSHPLFLSPVLI